jgi:iron complex outermembrane recepter protein
MKSIFRRARTQALTAFAGALALTSASQAQPAAAPRAAAAAQSENTLPTVQVVGRRINQVTVKEVSVGVLGDLPLVETPFSINVVTRELIDKQQSAFIGDLLKNDPSVAVGNVAVPFLSLRGFSVGSDGMLYDGLPGNGGLSDGRAAMQAINQVEVLKGASAFLHGIGAAGSLGGVINYIPKRPTEQPMRSVGVGVANRSLLSADVDVGGRLGADSEFGYRVNLGLRNGEQAVARYGWNQKVAALAFDWQLQPGLVLNLGFEHVENHNPELPPFYFLAEGVDVPAAPNTKRSAALSWDNFKTRSDNFYLRGDWTLASDWSMTAQALHNQNARPTTQEARLGQIDNAAGDITLFGGQDVSSARTNSAQLLLHGKFVGAGMKHRLTFGLTGSNQKSYGSSASLGLFQSNLYEPVDAPAPASVMLDNPLTSRIGNKSLLLSDVIDFGERWSALLGARRASLVVDNYDTTTGTVASTNKTTKTLPTVALMFKPIPGALIYANFSRGLEQGGALSPVESTQFLPPRLTRQVEVGAKLEQGGMVYTAALFDMRRPQEIFDASSGVNVQRGQQRHRGIELVANGRVIPALTLVSGLMLLDTQIGGTGDAANEGKRAVGVPSVTANLWAEYSITQAPGLALSAGVFHTGKQYLDGANTQTLRAWSRLDLGASYKTLVAGTAATFLLNVENATNRRYWASAQSGLLTMADPLTVKLGARVSF